MKKNTFDIPSVKFCLVYDICLIPFEDIDGLTFDDVLKTIEKVFEEKYINSDENTKRMYRCFFERYQDSSY